MASVKKTRAKKQSDQPVNPNVGPEGGPPDPGKKRRPAPAVKPKKK